MSLFVLNSASHSNLWWPAQWPGPLQHVLCLPSGDVEKQVRCNTSNLIQVSPLLLPSREHGKAALLGQSEAGNKATSLELLLVLEIIG